MAKRTTSGIMLFNSKLEILLEHPTNHSLDFWSIPKGVVDRGEENLIAAKREMIEETGLDIDSIDNQFLGEVPDILFKNKRKILKVFVYRTSENLDDFEFNCKSMVFQNNRREQIPKELQFPECDDFKWISIDDTRPLMHEAQQRALDWVLDNIKL